jgi:hypothetical protein
MAAVMPAMPATGLAPSGFTEDAAVPNVPPLSARGLAEGIRFLRSSAQLCDIYLVAGEQQFAAHQAMLCAMSPAFGSFIREAEKALQAEPPPEMAPVADSASTPQPQPEGEAPKTDATEAESIKSEVKEELKKEEIKQELMEVKEEKCEVKVTPASQLKLPISGVSHAESINIMLDYVYQVGTGASWSYNPSSLEVNTEILQLARQFGLKQLHEHAARWLAKDLTTKNFVERLVICEDFKLNRLRDKLIEQLTAHPTELSIVCRSAEITAHPKILQDLLVQVSSLCGMATAAEATSRKREAPEDLPEKEVEPEIMEKAEKVEKVEKERASEVAKVEKAPATKAGALKKKRTA